MFIDFNLLILLRSFPILSIQRLRPFHGIIVYLKIYPNNPNLTKQNQSKSKCFKRETFKKLFFLVNLKEWNKFILL